MAHTDADAESGTILEQATKVVAKPSGMVGITEYSDDMNKMGSLEFRFYTHGQPDTKAHKLGCPGCDPKAKDNPELALWFRLEAKWQAKGEPPSCPIARQAWFRAQFQNKPWWVEERDGKAHYDPAC